MTWGYWSHSRGNYGKSKGFAYFSELSGLLFALSIVLSKPHLLENKGHSRQSSDSSVDRLLLKEEVVEPTELENKASPSPTVQLHLHAPAYLWTSVIAPWCCDTERSRPMGAWRIPR